MIVWALRLGCDDIDDLLSALSEAFCTTRLEFDAEFDRIYDVARKSAARSRPAKSTIVPGLRSRLRYRHRHKTARSTSKCISTFPQMPGRAQYLDNEIEVLIENSKKSGPAYDCNVWTMEIC